MNELHPFAMFAATMAVVFSAAFLSDPIIMLIFLAAGFLTAALAGVKHLWTRGLIILGIALINPIFSHKGETILFFLNSRPITAEAFLYGLNIGIMLCGAILFMGAYSKVMSADKHLYLFEKINCQLGLLVSMAIRFVPLFAKKMKDISNAQKAMGMYSGEAVYDRLRERLSAFGGAMSWAFENGVTTAMSMDARGYGLRRRTSYSLFRFKPQDIFVILLTAVCTAVLAVTSDKITFSFYPYLSVLSAAKLPRIAFGVMCFCTGAVEIKERLTWKYSALKISPSHTARAAEIFSKI